MLEDAPESGAAYASTRDALRLMRIILIALVLGVSLLIGMLHFVPKPAGAGGAARGLWDPPTGVLSQVALAFALLAIALSVAYGRLFRAFGLKAIASAPSASHEESSKLIQAKISTFVCQLSVLEGAALFCAIAWWLEGDSRCLASAALLVAIMLAHFPTAAGLDRWLESARTDLELRRREHDYA